MLPASWAFDTIKKGNRSLNAENLSPFGQRASKLLALALKDLLFFSQCSEFQGAGSILRVGFALSK